MEKVIDIDKILHDKMGDKAKMVPKFVVKYLKHIIHQNQVNEFLNNSKDKFATDWLKACVEYLDIKLDVQGLENLPPKDNGKLYTFVSNHPLGGIDGVALGSVIGQHYDNKFRYLVNDLLMNLPGLAPLCIGINKTGRKGRDFPAMVEAGFHSNNHIMMFPAGLCSRKINGRIQDIEWKKTFISKSVETHRDIIPIYFGGANSAFFYNLARMCKFLHIKFNIAMLYLVDEMYKNTHKTFKIIIGKPISWQTFDKTKSAQQWAQEVRKMVYTLNERF